MDKSRFEQQAEEALNVPMTDSKIEAEIVNLAKLTVLQYARCRTDKARAFALAVTALDKMVREARKAEDASRVQTLEFPAIEPYPHPVDLAALLTEISAAIRQHVILGQEQADAVALWIAFTWLLDAAEFAPLLMINAPERACGKSHLMSVVGKLVYKPLTCSNLTAPFLFRVIELHAPTLLIDEVDTFMRENIELKGLVNAGHKRDGATVGRIVGDDHTPTMFSVWCAKVLTGIRLEKHLPDTTMSRCVPVDMRRKMPGETIDRLRYAKPELFGRLASKLARFSADSLADIAAIKPDLPPELSDRDQDNWEILLAIAQHAGTEWLKRATDAALTITSKPARITSLGVELLTDVNEYFETSCSEFAYSHELVEKLTDDPEKAWATYGYGGKKMTAKQMAGILKGFDIVPRQIFSGGRNRRGYDRAMFADSLERYASSTSNSPAIPAMPLDTNNGAGSRIAGADHLAAMPHRQTKNIAAMCSTPARPNASTGAGSSGIAGIAGKGYGEKHVVGTGQTHIKMVWRRDPTRTFRRVIVSPQQAAQLASVRSF